MESAHTFGEGPLAILELLRTCTDIVTARIPEHVIHSLFYRDVTPAFRQHDAEFGFIVARSILRELRHINCRWVWSIECCPRPDEQDRDFGNGGFCFFGGFVVVEAEAADYWDF